MVVACLLLAGCNAARCVEERADVAGFLRGLDDIPTDRSGAAFDRLRDRLGFTEGARACAPGQRCAIRRNPNVLFGPGTYVALTSRTARPARPASRYTLTLQSFHSACGAWPTTMNDEALTAILGPPDRIARRTRLLTELRKRYWLHRGGVVGVGAPGWQRTWISFQSPAMAGDAHAYVPDGASPDFPKLANAAGYLEKRATRSGPWKPASFMTAAREKVFELAGLTARLFADDFYEAAPKVNYRKIPGLVGVDLELAGRSFAPGRGALVELLSGLGLGDAAGVMAVFLKELAAPGFPVESRRSLAYGNYVLLMYRAGRASPVYRLGIWRRLEFWPDLRPPPI